MAVLGFRHGESYSNVSEVIADGWGLDLTPKGVAQAVAAGNKFADSEFADRAWDVVVSPSFRAQRTCELFLEASGITVDPVIVPELDVRHYGDALGKDKAYRKSFQSLDDIPGAESTAEYVARTMNFMQGLDPEADHLIFAHRGSLRALWSTASSTTLDDAIVYFEASRDIKLPHTAGIYIEGYDKPQPDIALTILPPQIEL